MAKGQAKSGREAGSDPDHPDKEKVINTVQCLKDGCLCLRAGLMRRADFDIICFEA